MQTSLLTEWAGVCSIEYPLWKNTQGETHELHKYIWGQAGIGSFMELGITAPRNIKVSIQGRCDLSTKLITRETCADASQDNCFNFWSQHLPQDYQQARQCSSSSFSAITDRGVWRAIIHWYQQLLIWPALSALWLQLFAGRRLNKWMREANAVMPMSGATRRPPLIRRVLFLRHVWTRPVQNRPVCYPIRASNLFMCASQCRSQSSSPFSMITLRLDS